MAYAAASAGSPLVPFSFHRRAPRAGDVLIEIAYCGVCHSDIHQVRNEWGGSIFPMVPGHEIVGHVRGVGTGVTKFRIGDRVGVGCFVDSCRSCGSCKSGLEQYCDEGMTLTYNGYERDGVTPTYGGYSTQIVVDENYVLRIPDGLAFDKAAPLLCAGITTFSPLRRWNAGPGMRVAVAGLGGLGHMAVKLAHAMGAEVTVLSHSESKKADARRLGAADFVNVSDVNSMKKLNSRFDLMINTISVDIDWNGYMNFLRRDGTMVLVGAPPGGPAVAGFTLIAKRRAIAGSMIGGITETQEMLDFCGTHGITSDIELIPIEKINEAYERTVAGDVRYRFVIDIASLR